MDQPEKFPCCPTCKDALDCVAPVEAKAKPSAGDVSVCLNCGEFLLFLDPPFVRRMEFIEEVKMDDDTLNLMKRIRASVMQRKMEDSILKNLKELKGGA